MGRRGLDAPPFPSGRPACRISSLRRGRVELSPQGTPRAIRGREQAMVRTRFGIGLAAIGLVLAAQPAQAALPARDAGVSYFPYSVGYSDGDLYVFGGDKIYRADPDGGG